MLLVKPNNLFIKKLNPASSLFLRLNIIEDQFKDKNKVQLVEEQCKQ
jgi:hypothetical protein